MCVGFYQVCGLWCYYYLYYFEWVGYYVGFIVNVFFLMDLNVVVGLGDGVVGIIVDVGGVFVVVVGDGVMLVFCFDYGDMW